MQELWTQKRIEEIKEQITNPNLNFYRTRNILLTFGNLGFGMYRYRNLREFCLTYGQEAIGVTSGTRVLIHDKTIYKNRKIKWV